MAAGVVGLTVAAVLVLSALVGAQLDRARARTAADAAALAAAAEDDAAARDLAGRNTAEVVAVDRDGDEVEVTVELNGVRASARAEREVPPAVGTGDRAGLQPAMLAAIARAEQLLGERIPIVSGYRSPAHQQRLWDNRHRNRYPVARPGTSKHELGLAIDVPRPFVARLAAVGPRAGLCRPLPRRDPIHFVLCPTP